MGSLLYLFSKQNSCMDSAAVPFFQLHAPSFYAFQGICSLLYFAFCFYGDIFEYFRKRREVKSQHLYNLKTIQNINLCFSDTKVYSFAVGLYINVNFVFIAPPVSAAMAFP